MVTLQDMLSLAGFTTGVISLLCTYRFNKEITKPKIQLNLEVDKNYNTDAIFTVKNISDYNLYDFKIKLKEIDKIKEKLKECPEVYDNIFNTNIPVFTINQTYSCSVIDFFRINMEYINIDVEYKIKKHRKKTIKETYTFNIKNFKTPYSKPQINRVVDELKNIVISIKEDKNIKIK